MHHRCQNAHDSCTVSGWRSAAHAAESSRRRTDRAQRTGSSRRSAAVTRRGTASSSDSPIHAAKRPRRSASAARPSPGASSPIVETIEMPWGAKLIPVDELETTSRRTKTGREATRGTGPARSSAGRDPRSARTNPHGAGRRCEPAPNRGWPKRRPNPNRPRRHQVVALDHSRRPGPLRAACIRSNRRARGGSSASDVITLGRDRPSLGR